MLSGGDDPPHASAATITDWFALGTSLRILPPSTLDPKTKMMNSALAAALRREGSST